MCRFGVDVIKIVGNIVTFQNYKFQEKFQTYRFEDANEIFHLFGAQIEDF